MQLSVPLLCEPCRAFVDCRSTARRAVAHDWETTMRNRLLLLILLTITSTASAGKFNRQLDVGDKAPAWTDLPGTDGKPHSLKEYEKSSVVVVAFIANHCPMATAYLPRWKRLVADFEGKPVTFVAISSSRFPADSLEHMKTHAKKHGFTFDYLTTVPRKSDGPMACSAPRRSSCSTGHDVCNTWEHSITTKTPNVSSIIISEMPSKRF